MSRNPLVDQIAEAFGLDFTGEREAQLVEAVGSRMRACRLRDEAGYLSLLRDPDRAPKELPMLAGRLTVAESSFLRHAKQLDALVDLVRRRLSTTTRTLRILSAGCARGEEPHSIAILLQERFLPSERARVEIVGIDVDPVHIEHARHGAYSPWSLRSTPPELLERWFAPQSDGYRLDAAVRGMVHFEVRNLMAPDPLFWLPGSFDVIICRNVLIYFTPEAMRMAIARFTRCLDANGHLFLGHSETLRGVSDEFELVAADDAFYYRKSPPSRRLPAQAARRPVPAEPAGHGGLYEMLNEERYADLLRLLADPVDPALVAMRAACQVNLDCMADAEATVRTGLERHPRSGQLHLLRGVVLERLADQGGAIDAYRQAIVEDETLAAGYLYLGRCYRRLGWLAEAREPLRQAVARLPGEHPHRLALVSGGFGKDLLLQIATSELSAANP